MSTDVPRHGARARRGRGRQLLAWSCPALLLGACFGGEFAQGLPCGRDADCGPQIGCIDGFCGGLGDSGLCGNGLLDVGEACDDGNTQDRDACTPACRLPVCGDGFLAADEACDDGNTADGDGCSAQCGACGDGHVDQGEACDDGNTAAGDGCTPVCQLSVCGDGYVGSGEQCDDGNELGTDACTPSCTSPSCGDGFVNAQAEACDDGNDVESDACTSACRLSPEAPVLELTLAQVKQFELHWQPALGAEYYQLFERADEGLEFVQVSGDIMGESLSLTVPLHFRAHASYKLRACNALRCEDSAVMDVAGALAEAVGYFKASNTDAQDHFGARLALSGDGNTLIVGAHAESSPFGGDPGDDSVDSAGAVYVFTHTSESWSQQAILKASNADRLDYFGRSVAVSEDGNTVAVGADSEDGIEAGIEANQSDDQTNVNAGAVYVFERIGESWSQQAYVKASNPGVDDAFGWSVALSGDGNTLAVGANSEASGTTVINGVQDDNSAPGAGAVYVLARADDETWHQQAYVKASDADAGDQFGHSVALSWDGTSLAVGAPYNDYAAGAVYVFAYTNSAWVEQDHFMGAGGDRFGIGLALSSDGELLAVGAPHGGDADTGAVHVFAQRNQTWSQQADIMASTPGAKDWFGYAVAFSGDGETLAVGAIQEASNATGIDGNQSNNAATDAGAVYVFGRSGEDWAQRAYVKASHTNGDDTFGLAVALSSDAGVLAVGAPGDNYAVTGIGNEPSTLAFDAGAVYLY